MWFLNYTLQWSEWRLGQRNAVLKAAQRCMYSVWRAAFHKMPQSTKLKAAVLLSCTESSCIESSMSSNTQIFLDVPTGLAMLAAKCMIWSSRLLCSTYRRSCGFKYLCEVGESCYEFRSYILKWVMGTRQTAGADPAWLAWAEVVEGLCVFVYEIWNSNLC